MNFFKSSALIAVFAILCFALNGSAAAQSDGKDAKPIVEGESAVDFELQGIGKKIKLSDNFGDDGRPVVVVFSRANW